MLTTIFACTITNGNFLGFPKWFKYLKGQEVNAHQGALAPSKVCVPQITEIGDIWLIVAAIVELLLRLAAIIAIFMVLWGAINYITSQGNPDQTNKARQTIINSLIGLVIAVSATGIITFIAGRF